MIVNQIFQFMTVMHGKNTLNIETIGGKIIEAGLRIGDIDQIEPFDPELFKSIIKLYDKHKWIETTYNGPQIFMFPVWGSVNNFLSPEMTEKFLLSYLKNIKLNSGDIIIYEIDTRKGAHPTSKDRLFNLTTNNYENGKIFKYIR